MQISPGTTRFFPSICLPHLLHTIPCSYRASACTAVLPSCTTLYVVSVRQARGLPAVSLFPHPASFRFHLTMDTLAFGYILPATGRIRVFHPLETCAAGRTVKTDRSERTGPSLRIRFAYCASSSGICCGIICCGSVCTVFLNSFSRLEKMGIISGALFWIFSFSSGM